MKRVISLVLALVMLLGGTQAASAAGGYSPGNFSFKLVRLGGSDRIETANLICAEGWVDKKNEPAGSGSSALPKGSDIPDVSGSDVSDSDVSSTDVFASVFLTADPVSESDEDSVVLGAVNPPDVSPSDVSPSDADGHTPIFAVIANGYEFADALAGVPFAYSIDAPILLTDGKLLKESVLDQIKRIGAEYVYILGGEKAVSADAEAQLKNSGCTTARLAGENRFGTAVAIAEEMQKIKRSVPETVFVAYGMNYPDALSAGSAAALLGSPILYSDSKGIPDELTKNYISSAAPDVVILGGTAAVSGDAEYNFSKLTNGSVSRISGSDRFATAINIYKAYSEVFTSKGFAIASGADFPDSLSGGVLSAKLGMPVLPVSTVRTTDGIYDIVKKNSPDKIYVFGGTGAVSDYVAYTLLSGGTVVDKTQKPAEKHIKRTLTVKVSKAKVYSGLSTSSSVVTTVKSGQSFTSLGEDEGPDGLSWFKIDVNGKVGWICRTNLNISNTYVPIEDRSFSYFNKPVIYLSPSKQGHNEYATGKTTEKKEMEAVAKVVKQILDKEYDCITYIATPDVDIIDRTDEALAYGADIYVAIHSNATGSSLKRYGATTYYFPGCAQSKLLSQNIVKELNKIAPVTPNFSPQVLNGMSPFFNIGYGEVRSPSNSGMIALLAETEYHDHATGSEWIRSHHNEIARAYATAIAETFDIPKK